MPCHRINKHGTHEHHRDHSAAVAIFANGTYFLDNPGIVIGFAQFIQPNGIEIVFETYSVGLCQTLTQHQ
jgi:hypothetical protein